MHRAASVFNTVEQNFRTALGQSFRVLADGGQPRVAVAPQRNTVIARNRDILRHTQAMVIQGTDRAQAIRSDMANTAVISGQCLSRYSMAVYPLCSENRA